MTLSRREIFRKAKEEAGGIDNLIQAAKNAPYVVYFDNDGNITAFTHEPNFTPRPEWKTYPFKQDQLEILKDSDLTKFIIIEDTLEQGLYRIQTKSIMVSYTTTGGFLTELTDSTDISCTLEKTCLKLKMSPEAKAEYTDKDPTASLFNGKKYIKVYVTAKRDPHSLFHSAVFSVESLILNSVVERMLTHDFTDCSVYAIL